MAAWFEESEATSPSCESVSASHPAAEVGDFECNICFELAQDPIVTLCGHLYCWPCLYRWLHHHSKCQEYPVCKALVQQDNLVPLYGRGKSAIDRSKPVPGVDIPSRPSEQRPQTAPSPLERNHLPNLGFGLLGGFIPIATATIGGDLQFSALYNFRMNLEGFPDAAMYGAAHGLPYGYGNAQESGVQPPYGGNAGQRQDSLLKWILLFLGFLVILALCLN